MFRIYEECKHIYFISFKELKKKGNILSSCLFKAQNSTRDFNEYIEGIKRTVKYLDSFENHIKLRIFFDSTIYRDKAIFDYFISCDRIEPIFYYSPKYFIPILSTKIQKKNEKIYLENEEVEFEGNEEYFMNLRGHHLQLFGAITRFMPFLDFLENLELDCVASIDADFPDKLVEMTGKENVIRLYYKFLFRNLNKIPKNSVVGFNTMIEIFAEKRRMWFDAAFTCLRNRTFDKKLLDDYLSIEKDIFNPKKEFYHDLIRKSITQFTYGSDEIFLNHYLFKKIKELYVIDIFNPNMLLYYFDRQLIKFNILPKSYIKQKDDELYQELYFNSEYDQENKKFMFEKKYINSFNDLMDKISEISQRPKLSYALRYSIDFILSLDLLQPLTPILTHIQKIKLDEESSEYILKNTIKI